MTVTHTTNSELFMMQPELVQQRNQSLQANPGANPNLVASGVIEHAAHEEDLDPNAQLSPV